MTAHGHADDRFAGLREAFERNLASGEELGAAIAVDLGGETVVDLWGGFADAARTRPWERDTIVCVWSTTKLITALAVLICVERGLVDLDAPVADYWPEFAQNGKATVRVRQLMSHTSGVSGWEQPFGVADLYDGEAATARLAAQAPWWEPGTASGYHAYNQGHLLGEVVRRVTGRTLTRFVADEIAAPLGADLQIGARPEDDERVAEIVPPPPAPNDLRTLDRQSPRFRTLTGPAIRAREANTVAWRRAELGAVNGHATAKGLARAMSAISLGGEVGGVRLLSERTIDLIFEEQARGVDLVLGIPLRFGLGFALPEPRTIPYLPDGDRLCFWGGWGGSMTVMLPRRRLTISYVMNKMGPDVLGSERSEAYVREILAAVG